MRLNQIKNRRIIMRNNKLYQEYLKSDEWKIKAEQCKKLADYKCAKCGSDEKLNAHHLTYKNVGDERMEDLQCLCFSCHNKEHGNTMEEHGAYSNIKRLNIKVCYMDLIETQSKLCRSSKDIILFGILFRYLDEENIIKPRSKKDALAQYPKSRVYKMLSDGVNIGFLRKKGRGQYQVNPFIIKGMDFKSNKVFEEVQTDWIMSQAGMHDI
jgi:hypothetical protein